MSPFSSFSAMFTIMWIFGACIFVFVFITIIRTFSQHARHRGILSNFDALRAAAEAVDELDEETPRSLAGMDSILLPQIMADFPDFSERQIKDRAAEYTAQTLRAQGVDVSCIHNCVFNAYDRTDPECAISMQLAVEARQNGRKRQLRYALICRSRDLSRDEQEVRSFNCPGCGAPLSGSSGKCDYCGTFVRRPFAQSWQFSRLRQV